jgi:endonuclease/exonuclease/phosphatase family metal-dependent hydrolase
MSNRTIFTLLFFGLFVTAMQAVEIRIATYNVLTGIGNVGDEGRAEFEAVIARIDPDVLALQEITGSDFNGPITEIAANLGYPFGFAPVTALDTGSRVIILSKFPLVPDSSESIISPPGANDVTRAAAAVVVNVPGTDNNPTIVTAHLKCCFDPDDPFRRAVEMLRIRKYLEEKGLHENDNVFMMGDFNLLGNDLVFSSLPPGLPQSYRLGSDINFDVNYYVDPVDYFTGLGLVNPGYRQQDGVTTDTFRGSDTILDYLLVSNSVASRMHRTEIYNSALDTANPGLPKEGTPLASGTSLAASDHYPVFGDFELDGGLQLEVSVAQEILNENSPSTLVTVTLPEPAQGPIQVTLQSSDSSEATIVDTVLTIPNNGTVASTSLQPKSDKISDGDQLIEITATSSGFIGNVAGVTIRDSDPIIYTFADATTSILEDFNGFEGEQSLAAWSDEGLTWIGNDDGGSSLNGARSYQGALGILTASEASFQTSFRNLSGQLIPALKIEFDAQHWRRFANGSDDRLKVSIVKGGTPIAVPGLNFQPITAGQSGQLSPPETHVRSAYVRDLDLADGDEVELLAEIIPGALGGSESSDVFINEFHYDNGGADVGEFIEIFVGQAFAGDISSVSVHLYNGSNGRRYGSSISLEQFTPGPSNTPGSPAFFFREISGIQNGAPDGIALEIDGVVREFLSYEGTFTAVDGIAAGMTSTSVGVTQGPGNPIGQRSIARTGLGGLAEDFTWGIQPGNFTPGEINLGQSFGASPQPQGIAIDNLVITPLRDQDGDRIPDQEEIEVGTSPALADTDQDGQDDYFESFLAGTDPLSSSSSFRPEVSLEQELVQVSFTSLTGRFYQVETSNDLENWTPVPGSAGTGEVITVSFTPQNMQFFRVCISVFE